MHLLFNKITDMTDREIEDFIRQTLLDNIDQIANNIANKLNVIYKIKPKIPTNELKDQFVKEYMFICDEAFKDGGWYKRYKTTAGTVLVNLARRYFEYKPTTYAGDIFSTIYKRYCKIKGIKRDYHFL